MQQNLTKNATGADKSQFPKTEDLTYLKSEFDYLDIDKLPESGRR